ncbi:MAG: NUDIX hydrolase [Candidatus Pacebacteria bacterium]|nr:NUDIX hydrolase [Candidatus Paceibacterota bacterium]
MTHQLFEITQNAIIINPKGEVLILRHASGPWLLPGGRINKGENWMDALKREIKEETGINNFEIKNILDVDSWFKEDGGKFSVTFLIKVDENNIIKLGEEHKEYAFIKEEDLKKYNFWHESIEKRIKEAFAFI